MCLVILGAKTRIIDDSGNKTRVQQPGPFLLQSGPLTLLSHWMGECEPGAIPARPVLPGQQNYMKVPVSDWRVFEFKADLGSRQETGVT